MKLIAEEIATEVFTKLIAYFEPQNKKIKISIEGAGVHWNCKMSLNNRLCKIHCFCGIRENPPEYLIHFIEENQDIAHGRTENLNQCLKSCEKWIKAYTLFEIYQEFPFVDEVKRMFLDIESNLLKLHPQFKELFLNLNHFGSDSYCYSIESTNRSCMLEKTGKLGTYSFHFYWDDCFLFVAENKNFEKIALAVKEWLINNILPSELEKNFLWINTGKLAKYYEKGEGVKGEFIESWNSIEEFYLRFNQVSTPKVLKLIKEIRKHNFESKIRAGQSLYNLTLSRARKHGLTKNQPYLVFLFGYDKDVMQIKNEKDTSLYNGNIKYSVELDNLLKELVEVEIN